MSDLIPFPNRPVQLPDRTDLHLVECSASRRWFIDHCDENMDWCQILGSFFDRRDRAEAALAVYVAAARRAGGLTDAVYRSSLAEIEAAR